jgi:hypothetical protein
MTTRITQVDGRKNKTLKVEGSLVLEDALLLAKVCADLRQQGEQEITIALDELVFLDTSSAFVLSRLKHQGGVSLEGACFFVHQVLELAEKQSDNKFNSK